MSLRAEYNSNIKKITISARGNLTLRGCAKYDSSLIIPTASMCKTQLFKPKMVPEEKRLS